MTDEARPGTWDLVGRNMDNEDVFDSKKDLLAEALKREVKEEVGVNLGDIRISSTYVDSGYNPEGFMVIWIGWKCKLDKKPGVKISNEHSEYKWVTKDEFAKLDFGFARTSFLNMLDKINL